MNVWLMCALRIILYYVVKVNFILYLFTYSQILSVCPIYIVCTYSKIDILKQHVYLNQIVSQLL